MGGVVGVLLGLYCRSGCQAQVVASALAFQPPDPFYKIKYDEDSKTYKIYLSHDVRDIPFDMGTIKVEIISDKTNYTKVPVICLKYPGAKYTLIYSHGNATDLGAMYAMYAIMAITLKINIVGYDYTGYGSSMEHGTRPTEKQTYIDIKRVYQWCIDEKLVTDPAKQIILYGQSVGSGPSCYLAANWKKYPVAGLCLHSPIMSGLRVITSSRLLACFDIFPNIKQIEKVRCPVFILHGQMDTEVHFNHGLLLQAAVQKEYQCEPWWVPNRQHNDVLMGNEEEFFKRMKKFLQAVEVGKGNIISQDWAEDTRLGSVSGSGAKGGSNGRSSSVVLDTVSDTDTTQ